MNPSFYSNRIHPSLSFEIRRFISKNKLACVLTLGLAILGYSVVKLGGRVFSWIQKCFGTTKKVNLIAPKSLHIPVQQQNSFSRQSINISSTTQDLGDRIKKLEDKTDVVQLDMLKDLDNLLKNSESQSIRTKSISSSSDSSSSQSVLSDSEIKERDFDDSKGVIDKQDEDTGKSYGPDSSKVIIWRYNGTLHLLKNAKDVQFKNIDQGAGNPLRMALKPIETRVVTKELLSELKPYSIGLYFVPIECLIPQETKFATCLNLNPFRMCTNSFWDLSSEDQCKYLEKEIRAYILSFTETKTPINKSYGEIYRSFMSFGFFLVDYTKVKVKNIPDQGLGKVYYENDLKHYRSDLFQIDALDLFDFYVDQSHLLDLIVDDKNKLDEINNLFVDLILSKIIHSLEEMLIFQERDQ